MRPSFADLKGMIDYIASHSRRKGGDEMEKTYTWTVNGADVTGQRFSVKGEYVIEISDFPLLFDRILRDVFQQLAHGKAIFEHPGVGCKGPYDFTSVLIVRK